RTRASADVASDVVGVVRLGFCGIHGRAPEDEVHEPGCETFDLGLDASGHVDRRASRHVAVGPERLLSGRGSGWVHDAWLDDDAVGAIRVATGRDVSLALGHLGEGAPDMHGSRPAAYRCIPGHWARERPVDLADARAVLEPGRSAPVPGREPLACDGDQSLKRGIEYHRGGRGKFGHVFYEPPGMHAPAGVTELGDQRVDHSGTAPLNERPA